MRATTRRPLNVRSIWVDSRERHSTIQRLRASGIQSSQNRESGDFGFWILDFGFRSAEAVFGEVGADRHNSKIQNPKSPD
jgi:hypothetical protein